VTLFLMILCLFIVADAAIFHDLLPPFLVVKNSFERVSYTPCQRECVIVAIRDDADLLA